MDPAPCEENAGPNQRATTAMARQLEAHPALSTRLAWSWTRVVVLERLARGAGATDWFLAKSQQDVRRIFGMLKPGSRVTFSFGGPLRVEPLSETVIGAMFEVVGVDSELVIGTPRVMEPLILDATLVFGPNELAEYLMQQPRPAGDLVWGVFPGAEELDAVTVVLVDNDGTLRPHPH